MARDREGGAWLMPGRIIKESIWTSPNLNALSPPAERHFYRLLPAPDDHGCFEATPAVVKGRCYPLRPEVRVNDIAKWHRELEESGICRFWEQHGRVYGVFLSWQDHQRIRSLHKRKTPEPPAEILTPIDDSCRQVPTGDALNPNPNPNPNSPNPPKGGGYPAAFEAWWDEYPAKKGKKAAYRAFEKARKEVEPEKLLDALRAQKAADAFRGRDGQTYIPNPATWLNQGRWEDEVGGGAGDPADELPPELRH
ncbi:hypothetical protein [Salidesulfovibrio brasiliensis]|uniref:hypothetical protein n=1 Tax=Salidesulfovibrio brasiliensis TaxID=221711 RepID=UPI0012EDA273|nr:hypothetical protein [Salidesulfovibrio brasiliensis]